MRSLNKIYQERTNLKTWLIAIIVGLVGLSLLFWATQADLWIDKEVFRGFVNALGVLLLVPVSISVLWELFLRRTFVDELANRFSIAEEIRTAGIIGYSEEFTHGTEWTSYFNNSNRLDIFFSYGRTWRNVNEKNIQDFISRGKQIRVVLPDPGHEHTMLELARRFNMSHEEVVGNVTEAIEYFQNLKSTNQDASINVWLLPQPPMYSFYRFDNLLILTLFKHRPGRGGIPVLMARSGGKLFNYISSELDAMIKEDGTAQRIN